MKLTIAPHFIMILNLYNSFLFKPSEDQFLLKKRKFLANFGKELETEGNLNL